MIIIDGRAVAKKIRGRVEQQALIFEQTYKEKIKLSVILVGRNPASRLYVRNKQQACEEHGLLSELHLLNNITPEKLERLIKKLNADQSVHGILLQLPLPEQLNPKKLLQMIKAEKDVDGFHPFNVGLLSQGFPELVSCTPKGILTLLDAYELSVKGKNVLILGRSNIVGKPLFNLLLARDATVTIAHSQTKNIPELCKKADIIIAAIGVPFFVQKKWVKKTAILIDVGINHVERKDHCEFVGDISDEAKQYAAFATPVPGGVGPMTIASLLENLVTAAFAQKGTKVDF